jgi:hypothetical protein
LVVEERKEQEERSEREGEDVLCGLSQNYKSLENSLLCDTTLIA